VNKSEVIDFLGSFRKRIKSTDKSDTAEAPASKRFGEVKGADGIEDFSPIEPGITPLKFDIAALLQLKTFLYLLGATLIFLVQTYNTLAIINLARQNEKLREQILMTSSVITSQELKVHELHSIHNIAQDALKIGLEPSGIPPVELRP
jgi:hypothetical protein